MILAVVGLQREARIVAGKGVRVVIGGGDAAGLARRLAEAFNGDIEGVISVGLCGALDPTLRPGDLVAASAVRDGRDWFPTYLGWTKHLLRRLPHAVTGSIVGSDAILATTEAKAELYGASGAVAVDMESHLAARFARRHMLPMAVLRAVSDGAGHALPEAAQKGMRPDGSMDVGAVVQALTDDPRQLPALIRTGLGAEKGFRALLRCHRLLGPRLGFGQVGDHALDMT